MNLAEAKAELDAHIKKLEAVQPKNRLLALIITKLQEAGHWYRDLLEDPEAVELWKNEKSDNK